MCYYIRLQINNTSYVLKIPHNDTKLVFAITAEIINNLKANTPSDIYNLQSIIQSKFNCDVSIGEIISEINYPV